MAAGQSTIRRANLAVVLQLVAAEGESSRAGIALRTGLNKSTVSSLVAELIATNEERMLAHPAIIERLYMNKATRMSTADRIIEIAVRHRLELTGIPAYKEVSIAIGRWFLTLYYFPPP